MLSKQAYIHPGAKIADNVTIEPFAVVKDNVVIEEGSWIASIAYLMEGSRIGKNCKIFPGAVIASTPQDIKYKGSYCCIRVCGLFSPTKGGLSSLSLTFIANTQKSIV